MEDILVSIWCTTYNHASYVKDAIEGFLAQDTNFQYEIIIHDDASTDGTNEIIREYEKKYPDLIFTYYQRENQYSKNHPKVKWIQDLAIQKCRGKYIAVCEGDDYWIDSNKLQLQVDYLELHPEYIMTVHDAFVIDCRNNKVKQGNTYEKDCLVSAEDIISQKRWISTASMVYRREVLQMQGFFLNAGILDYPRILYSFTLGKVFYFNRKMSVYRQYHKGSWTNSILDNQVWCMHNIRMIEFLEKYNEYTQCKYNVYLTIRIQKSAIRILESLGTLNKNKVFENLDNLIKETKKEIYSAQLKRLWLQLFDNKYISNELIEFCSGYSKLIIMGAGKYASIIARQLSYHEIPFEGFVVSNSESGVDYYLDRPVWKFETLPFDLKKIGIIIGINPIIWDQILNSLNDAKVMNYTCPFLF